MEKECYEEEVQPYRRTDYKPIIYIYNGKLISADNAFSILVCIPSIHAALFSFRFLNFFSTMCGSIYVSISFEHFLSLNCCLDFVIDSIFSLVNTEPKKVFRIFAFFRSSKLNFTIFVY